MLPLIYHKFLADFDILLFDLFDLSFLKIPVTARNVLKFIIFVGADRRLHMPYLFEKEHVLFFEMVFLLLLLKGLGCWLRFPKIFGHLFYLFLPLLNKILLLLSNSAQYFSMFLIFFGKVFLEEFVLIDRTRTQNNCLHQ